MQLTMDCGHIQYWPRKSVQAKGYTDLELNHVCGGVAMYKYGYGWALLYSKYVNVRKPTVLYSDSYSD